MAQTLYGLILILLLFSGVFVASVFFASNATSNYNITIENKSSINVLTNMRTLSENMTQPLNTTEINAYTGATFFLSAITNSVVMVFTMGALFPVLIMEIGKALFLPEWFTGMILSIITFIIVIGVIRVLTGRGRV